MLFQKGDCREKRLFIPLSLWNETFAVMMERDIACIDDNSTIRAWIIKEGLFGSRRFSRQIEIPLWQNLLEKWMTTTPDVIPHLIDYCYL